jgi:hypothetical protein
MKNITNIFLIWPEDPAWPDPSGNDPYDVRGNLLGPAV